MTKKRLSATIAVENSVSKNFYSMKEPNEPQPGGGENIADQPGTKQLTLEQARLRYEDEEMRRRAVEGKIGVIITVDALIISVGGIFTERGAFVLLGMIVALLSVAIGLWALRTRNYYRPGKDIDDFIQYEDLDDEVQRKQLLLDYIVALDGNEGAVDPEERTVGNRKKNDRKYRLFDYCVILTGLALAMILVTPIAEGLELLDIL